MVWEVLNQRQDSGIYMQARSTGSLHFGPPLWIYGEETSRNTEKTEETHVYMKQPYRENTNTWYNCLHNNKGKD